MINLTSYKAIQSNLFVKIEQGSFNLLFSDRLQNTMLDDSYYTGIGGLLSISGTASELRSSSGNLSISVSGIPNTSLEEVLAPRLKGSNVTIYRYLFNPTTNLPLQIDGNPLARFRGFVNNYTLTEDYDVASRTSSNTITFTCASSVDVLSNKISGRKTNPQSQKQYYPLDISMDRVPALENATFDFGAPK